MTTVGVKGLNSLTTELLLDWSPC